MKVTIKLPYVSTKTSEVIKAVQRLEKEFQDVEFALSLEYMGGPYKCEKDKCPMDLR